jgi:hypothetical protein
VQIFDYWKQQSGHTKARLTEKRTKIILARRRRFSVEELMTALRCACQDDFYKEGNYDWPETILKNDEAVERHIDRASNGRKTKGKRDPLAEFVEAQVRASQGI